MRHRKGRFLALIFLQIMLFFTTFSGRSVATAPTVPPMFYNYEIGGLIPHNRTSVELVSSSTNIWINASDNDENMSFLRFNSSFILYNPGEAANISVAVPIAWCFDVINSSFFFKVNGIIHPNSTIANCSWGLTSYLMEEYWIILAYYLGADLQVPGNSRMLVECSFESLIFTRLYDMNLQYRFGTVRGWAGNTSGTVEMQVIGEQPVVIGISGLNGTSISSGEVSEIDGGTSYRWNWDAGYHIYAGVYIGYRNGPPIPGCVHDDLPPSNSFPFDYMGVFPGFATVSGIFAALYFSLRKKK